MSRLMVFQLADYKAFLRRWAVMMCLQGGKSMLCVSLASSADL